MSKIEIETPRPRAPSAWHAASRSSPRHDALQAEFLAWLRTRPISGLPEGAIVHRHVEAEYPLKRGGEIVAYVDAVEILHVGMSFCVSLFEIKPQIDTPFGIVRQVKSYLDLAAREWPDADQITAHVVVPHADPQLPDLRAEWPQTWAWGVSFEPESADE